MPGNFLTKLASDVFKLGEKVVAKPVDTLAGEALPRLLPRSTEDIDFLRQFTLAFKQNDERGIFAAGVIDPVFTEHIASTVADTPISKILSQPIPMHELDSTIQTAWAANEGARVRTELLYLQTAQQQLDLGMQAKLGYQNTSLKLEQQLKDFDETFSSFLDTDSDVAEWASRRNTLLNDLHTVREQVHLTPETSEDALAQLAAAEAELIGIHVRGARIRAKQQFLQHLAVDDRIANRLVLVPDGLAIKEPTQFWKEGDGLKVVSEPVLSNKTVEKILIAREQPKRMWEARNAVLEEAQLEARKPMPLSVQTLEKEARAAYTPVTPSVEDIATERATRAVTRSQPEIQAKKLHIINPTGHQDAGFTLANADRVEYMTPFLDVYEKLSAFQNAGDFNSKRILMYDLLDAAVKNPGVLAHDIYDSVSEHLAQYGSFGQLAPQYQRAVEWWGDFHLSYENALGIKAATLNQQLGYGVESSMSGVGATASMLQEVLDQQGSPTGIFEFIGNQLGEMTKHDKLSLRIANTPKVFPAAYQAAMQTNKAIHEALVYTGQAAKYEIFDTTRFSQALWHYDSRAADLLYLVDKSIDLRDAVKNHLNLDDALAKLGKTRDDVDAAFDAGFTKIRLKAKKVKKVDDDLTKVLTQSEKLAEARLVMQGYQGAVDAAWEAASTARTQAKANDLIGKTSTLRNALRNMEHTKEVLIRQKKNLLAKVARHKDAEALIQLEPEVGNILSKQAKSIDQMVEEIDGKLSLIDDIQTKAIDHINEALQGDLEITSVESLDAVLKNIDALHSKLLWGKQRNVSQVIRDEAGNIQYEYDAQGFVKKEKRRRLSVTPRGALSLFDEPFSQGKGQGQTGIILGRLSDLTALRPMSPRAITISDALKDNALWGRTLKEAEEMGFNLHVISRGVDDASLLYFLRDVDTIKRSPFLTAKGEKVTKPGSKQLAKNLPAARQHLLMNLSAPQRHLFFEGDPQDRIQHFVYVESSVEGKNVSGKKAFFATLNELYSWMRASAAIKGSGKAEHGVMGEGNRAWGELARQTAEKMKELGLVHTQGQYRRVEAQVLRVRDIAHGIQLRSVLGAADRPGLTLSREETERAARQLRDVHSFFGNTSPSELNISNIYLKDAARKNPIAFELFKRWANIGERIVRADDVPKIVDKVAAEMADILRNYNPGLQRKISAAEARTEAFIKKENRARVIAKEQSAAERRAIAIADQKARWDRKEQERIAGMAWLKDKEEHPVTPLVHVDVKEEGRKLTAQERLARMRNRRKEQELRAQAKSISDYIVSSPNRFRIIKPKG